MSIAACAGLVALSAAAGLGLGPFRLDAVAQTAAASADELRPVFATPEDIAEGKELAQASCESCHGADGVSNAAGVPNLAGQRPSYVYRVLKADQVRGHPGGRGVPNLRLLKFFSDDALVKVAAYYASLDPAPPAAEASAAPYVDPIEAGKKAAAACVGCHGEGGVSATPGFPSLTGQQPQYLVTAIKDYQSGRRQNDMMKGAVASLSDADMNHIALFFALQRPARAGTSAEGDAAAGKAAAAGCAGCHGDRGISGDPTIPSLAGQDSAYLIQALQSYKTAKRGDETMKGVASPLDDAAMKNIAAYYAALEPEPVKVARPLSPDAWAQKCNHCHGLNGNSTQVNVPALAGQRMDYLEAALRDYQTGARKNSEMAAMSGALSGDDIIGLAAYYARQKPRAFVFVTAPAK